MKPELVSSKSHCRDSSGRQVCWIFLSWNICDGYLLVISTLTNLFDSSFHKDGLLSVGDQPVKYTFGVCPDASVDDLVCDPELFLHIIETSNSQEEAEEL